MSDERWGVGDQADAKAFDRTTVYCRPVELIFGQHPHSRRDNNIYARDVVDGTIHEFDGHRRLVDIRITSSNYLKTSELSGDEIRKAVHGEIVADGVVVYEFSHREPAEALLRAYRLLTVLQEHESGWLDAGLRAKLVGRKIYYHDFPAIITSLIEDQGCIIISCDPPAGARLRGKPVEEQWEYYRMRGVGGYHIKDDVLSPHIWWFRDS